MALDTTRLGRLLPCCGHSTGRHIRLDPDDAKSVICAAINYKPARSSGIIASYALYQDYHTFIKQKLLELAEFIKKEIDKNLKFKICN